MPAKDRPTSNIARSIVPASIAAPNVKQREPARTMRRCPYLSARAPATSEGIAPANRRKDTVRPRIVGVRAAIELTKAGISVMLPIEPVSYLHKILTYTTEG